MTSNVNSQRCTNCCSRFLKAEFEDIKSFMFWRACFAEFVGTLLLCFYHIGILLFMPEDEPPPLLHVAVGHGLYVATVVTSLGETSGCHMNPAVTLALVTLGQVRAARSCMYIIAQCAGAISGTMLLREINPDSMIGNLGLISPGANISDKQVIGTEIVITSFLLIVVVATSDERRSDIQGSVPLIVGLTIVVNTLLANKVSGSCMNPARALGPAVVMGNYTNLWMYWLGPCCGAVAGANLYNHCLSPAAPSPFRMDCCSGDTDSADAIKPEAEIILIDTIPETDL